MNDYDDLDEYSSENSFRARSNTWPLNRPDYALPSSGANIDETLPEIELEDDDLFTTNENWSTGVIDHDIMSWDPILNAQNQQQQQQQQQKQQPPPPSPQQQQPQRQTQEANQPSTVHHHHQQPPPHQTQAQHQTRHQLPPPSSATTSTTAAATAVAAAATAQQHQHQQSVHLQLNHLHQHHQQPQLRRDPQRIAQQHRPDQPQHQHQHHQHPHQQHHQHHQHHLHHHNPQQSESFIDVAGSQGAIASSQNTAQLHHQPTQLQHQLSPQPSVQHVHQTLNSAHCLDPEDSNEYHLQQLHHLHLDNPPLAAITDAQQDQFAPTLTSLCVYNTTTNLNNDSYNISPNQNQHHLHHQQQPHHSHQHQTQHHHQHLQPLASARYDLDPQVGAIVGGEYDIKPLEDTLHQQQGHLHQPHLHHDPQLVHHQHLQRQQPQLHQHHHHQHHEQQAHPLHSQHIHQNPHQPHVSSSLDNHSSGSLLLSSSLGTSGIGLSGDLEDLDFKPNLDGASLLAHQNYDGEQPQLTSEQLGPEQPVQATDGGVGGGVGGGGGASSSGGVASDTKKSDSTSTSKVAKQNVPRRNAWGNMSYADLISQAINSTSDKRLTLSQIYDWMVQHVPYFKDKGDSNSSAGWKNSVRHNLSLHSRFKRLQNEGTGKSSWWTINPEANVGKCARRRAASMEASKYEKKRGRAKKKAEAIRQGLVSYPSLTSTSRNGSTSTLEQQPSQAPSLNQFQPTLQQPDEQVEQEAQIEQQSQAGQQLEQQLVMPSHRPQVQIQSIDQYGINRPSQQQQQHLQQLQKSDARSREELNQQNDQDIFASHQQQQQSAIQSAQQQHHHRLPEQPCYEENNDNSKLQQQQQQQQQQQSQYYYQFELSTAL